MAKSSVILLYDIPGNCSKDGAFSPNIWKTRYVLNYKRLPYKTVWVEFPDIASVAQKIGAPPSAIRRNGTPYYSLPIIYDPATDKYISNSLDIARHLDTVYPETPRVIPQGSDALIAAFDSLLHEKAVPPLFPLMFERVHAQLNPASQSYFRKTREALVKKPFEQLYTPETASGLWKAYENSLAPFAGFASGHGPFLAGVQMSYADIAMAAWFTWMKLVYGPQSEEWKMVERWHDGRWGRMMAEFAKLEFTDGNPPQPKL